MTETMEEIPLKVLKSEVQRLRDGTPGPNDLLILQQALTSGQIVIASGERSVAIGGEVHSSIIITGDNTTFTLTSEAVEMLSPSYQPLEPPQPDELPDPGDLPPGSRMLFSRNRVFTGREGKLLELARGLLYNGSSSMVVTGFGGTGKSQLASEFCYRYGRFFQGVHWLQADQDIKADIAACGAVMGLPRWPTELPDQVEMTLKSWQEGTPRLVVMDNVEDPAEIQDWLPRMTRCRLLLTSRRNIWPPDLGLVSIDLDVLPRPQSRELLCKLASRLVKVADYELDAVAKRLGDMPLALDLAGRYLSERPELSPEDYLSELTASGSFLEHTSFLDWVEHSPTKHATSLAATFALSWDRLTENEIDGIARRVFRACGYYAPSIPISRQLLTRAIGSDGSTQQKKLDKALRRLSRLGLVIPTNTGPGVHTLLAEFARMQDRNAEESALPALADGLADLANQANESGLPENMKPLSEHLRFVAEAADVAELGIAGLLWNVLGYHLRVVSNYEGAKEHFERAVEIDEKMYGPGHPNVANHLNNLGSVLQNMGDSDGARKCHEKALKINEATYGPDHPTVAIDCNNLGSVLQDMGYLEEAKKLYERALKIDEDVYGPDHPNVAIRVNNLGRVLQDMGDLEDAKEMFEWAIEIGEIILGSDHPEVAVRVNNLGSVLQDMGQLEEAKKLYKRALEIDEKVYGPDHPEVATDVNNLGEVLRYQGDLVGAKKHLERALEIREKVYGPDHPEVAMAAYNLGDVLRNQGNLVGAKKHFERTLEILQERLGENHPYTVTVRNHLGLVKRQM